MASFLERLKGDPARIRLERLERLQGLTGELAAAQTRDEVLRVVFERGLGLVDASERARLFDASSRLAERLRQLLSAASVISTVSKLRRYTTTWFPVRVHGEVAGVGVLVRDHRG